MTWNAADDMARWDRIALDVHQRAHGRRSSPYVRAMSIVEASAHRHVANATKGARRVLEIGVGGGEHLVFAGKPELHELYVGIDLDPGFARVCNERHGIPVAIANVEALPFPAARFDAVLALSLLEHVERLSTALGEIERVLDPGGSLHVVIPTNGSFAVGAFKQLVTYPTLRLAGIKRPDLVWATLNVNDYKRVSAALQRRFRLVRQQALPMRFLPWHLSPLWVFECAKR
jgi:SAM-dependent methyltransferase